MLKELCRIYQVDEPANLDSLRLGISQHFCSNIEKQKAKIIETDDDDDDEDEDLEEDIPLATEENDANKNKVRSNDSIFVVGTCVLFNFWISERRHEDGVYWNPREVKKQTKKRSYERIHNWLCSS